MHLLTKDIFIEPNGFGQYTPDIVHTLLKHIALEINTLTQTPIIKECYIYKSPYDYPLCSKKGNAHEIYLATERNYWCQWIYQFAHEYLHHVIDGELTEEITGMVWFEESLAELSSIFHLGEIYRLSTAGQIPISREYATAILTYQKDLLESNQDLKSQINENGGIRQWLSLLSDAKYHRNHYNAVACRILPVFETTPSLWRIVPHIGDSRRYSSLDKLFFHLRKTADDSYRDALDKMINLLLSTSVDKDLCSNM